MLQTLNSPDRTPPSTVHVVGAGLAGLSAAVRLSKGGHRTIVYEAAPHAGGRCRSYYDAAFGSVIDNGNHLVLSGNTATMSFLDLIGSRKKLSQPEKAEFPFVDAATGARWTLLINDGRFPGWLFDKSRRVPDTTPADYLSAAGLMWAGAATRITDVIGAGGALYERLWKPVLLSALNTDPREASARLAGAIMKNTLAKGGAACRPLVADGLSEAFVDPALRYIENNGGAVHFGQRLRAIEIAGNGAAALTIGAARLPVHAGDAVVLAVPPWIASELLPGLQTPTEFRAIVNGHFRVAPPPSLPRILGVVNAKVEWIFAFPGRLSITISGADRFADTPREQLATDLWAELASITGLSRDLPPWQIVKERRATFAATPEQDARRPIARTRSRNIFLAGDWTATGLPATIEGAIRSGERAASLAGEAVLAMKGHRRRDGRKLSGILQRFR